MEINHRFLPRNDQEIQMVKAIELASEILEEKLNVKIVLQAQRQPGWAGADAFHAGMYVSEDRMIKINFRNLTGASAKIVLGVLGHEFRHAVQYQHGMKSGRVWNGPNVENMAMNTSSRFARYYNQPHEVDARMYQDVYANMVISDPRFSEMINLLNVPGEPMMKQDRDATYKMLGFTGREDPDMKIFRMNDGTFGHLRLSEVYPNKKRWTNPLAQKALKEFTDKIHANKFEFLMVPVTLDDFVS